MAEYKKFLIQQETYNGSTDTNVGDVIDTYTKFGVVCSECPFKVLPETKDIAKRDWYDEHGDDVYIPADGLKFKAYDMEVKFIYAGAQSQMTTKLRDFIDFICGRTNIVSGATVATNNATKNVLLKIYDEYTQIGRRRVYVQSVDDELYFYDDVNGIDNAIAEFKVKFVVTDPVSQITLSVS